jgi:hypothetical protein
MGVLLALMGFMCCKVSTSHVVVHPSPLLEPSPPMDENMGLKTTMVQFRDDVISSHQIRIKIS